MDTNLAPATPKTRFFRRPAVMLFLVLSMVLGMGAYTFADARGLSYLSNDPKACVNCHVMNDNYDSWQKSSHHAVASCNDCHVPHDLLGKYLAKAKHGWRHSKAFTTGDYHDPIQVHPESRREIQDNCLRCHGKLTDAIAGHAKLGKTDEVNCIRCHATVGHGGR
ncbi:MAG: cytochrome c nitrite reductase small subunit [Verrucomicrobiota bacterium]|jgi:cytochrome c nitrite reductase small subunit